MVTHNDNKNIHCKYSHHSFIVTIIYRILNRLYTPITNNQRRKIWVGPSIMQVRMLNMHLVKIVCMVY